MNDEEFGTTEDYVRAFEAVRAEGIPASHLALLQAHFDSPDQVATARQLAERINYKNYSAVNLQYGTFARRVAERLSVLEPPRSFWLFVLVDWAERDVGGDTAFILRRPVVEALVSLGIVRPEL